MTEKERQKGKGAPGRSSGETLKSPACDRVALERRSWFCRLAYACDLFDAMAPAERRRSGLAAGQTRIDILGKALWVTFALVVISGVGLLAGYHPTVPGAFSSVEHIQTSFPAGWWLRGVHKYGCDLFVILAAIRLLRIAFRRAYKNGGEFTWISALCLLIFGMVSGLTGYLLVWNERAFWFGRLLGASAQRFEEAYPLGGLGLAGWLSRIVVGDEGMSQSTLTGVFAVHIALSLLVLIVALRWRLAPRRQSPKHRAFMPAIPAGTTWLILGGLTLLALLIPPPLGGPVDRMIPPHPIISDWYFLATYQLFRIVSPPSATTFVFIGLAVAVLLPWLDRSRKRGPRPAVLALICATSLTWLIMTIGAAADEQAGAAVLVMSVAVWLLALAVGIWGELRVNSAKTRRSKSEVSGT